MLAGLFLKLRWEVPLTALGVARKSYGTAAAFLFSVLFTFVNRGWFGLNAAGAGETLSAITHKSSELGFGIIGVIQVILVLFGMKWLVQASWQNRILFGSLGRHYGIGNGLYSQQGTGNWNLALLGAHAPV